MAMGFNIGFHLSGQDFMNLLCKRVKGPIKNLLPTPFFPLFEGREIWPPNPSLRQKERAAHTELGIGEMFSDSILEAAVSKACIARDLPVKNLLSLFKYREPGEPASGVFVP